MHWERLFDCMLLYTQRANIHRERCPPSPHFYIVTIFDAVAVAVVRCCEFYFRDFIGSMCSNHSLQCAVEFNQ